MKQLSLILASLFIFSMGQCFASTNHQIFSSDNTDGKITAKTIEEAFNTSDMYVDVNNDMNSIFSKRYKKVHHKHYNLAIFMNAKSVATLMKKYPSIGLITPLSMSIYSDENNHINISTLSLEGMARMTQIPVTNPDLIAYAKLLDNALHKALPKGSYIKHSDSAKKIETLVTVFTTEFDLEEGETSVDAKDAFKEEFESEIGSLGFLVPKSYGFESEEYDFYDTYSIIRFNVIFPVSKASPDAGAYAPFSLSIYKKKSEDTVHIAFPSISNWANNLAVSDAKSLEEIKKTQTMMQEILEELTE
jgi:uncharacterized protein (DUF302 family)